jgi:16S rRNA (uracil1498-N3)-methyltransferase
MSQRYFLPSLPPPGPAELHGDLAHHLGRVLRVRPGDEVRLGDGHGGTALATVVAATKTSVQVTVAAASLAPPPPIRVHVAFAPPRLARAEWLFEHGTEAGIAVFHPLWTTRTRPQGERPERWLRIVQAAAGQSDRAWLPEVRPVREFAAFLASQLPAARFLAHPGAPSLLERRGVHDEPLLLVGPEGGLSPDEERAAIAAGFVPAGLGPHILRTETAALVGAALLLAR